MELNSRNKRRVFLPLYLSEKQQNRFKALFTVYDIKNHLVALLPSIQKYSWNRIVIYKRLNKLYSRRQFPYPIALEFGL